LPHGKAEKDNGTTIGKTATVLPLFLFVAHGWSLLREKKSFYIASMNEMCSQCYCRIAIAELVACKENSSGSKCFPTQARITFCSGCCGFHCASSRCSYPPMPPQSSGGHVLAPSRPKADRSFYLEMLSCMVSLC
jgi:hypothetical protein